MKVGLVFIGTSFAAAAAVMATAQRSVAPALAQSSETCSSARAGKVIKVVHTTTTLNQKYVSGPRKISSGDRLATKKHAEVIFCLSPDVNCTLHQKGFVRVKPPHTTLLMRFARGRMSCGTTLALNPPLKKKILTAAGATLHVDDPLFVVNTNAVSTVVKVVAGVVVVGSDGALAFVGPGQKVSIKAGDVPGSPQPLGPNDLNAAERRDVKRLTPKLPKPDYSRPPIGNSSTLGRIYSRGAIELGIDTSTQAAKDGFTFAAGYFGFLAGHWKLATSTRGMDSVSAENRLCGGAVDVYATPNPDAVRVNPWRMPFFEDRSGNVWYLVGLDDNTFRLDLRAFLIGTLQAGDYGKIYSEAFGATPSYAIFDPLLSGPGKTPAPFCIS